MIRASAVGNAERGGHAVGRERHTASVAVKHPEPFTMARCSSLGATLRRQRDGGWDGKQYLGDLWELETDAFVKASVDGYGRVRETSLCGIRISMSAPPRKWILTCASQTSTFACGLTTLHERCPD